MSDDQHLMPELAIRLELYRLECERDEARRALDVARAKHELDARVWHERDKRAALDLFACESDLGRALKRAEDMSKELDEARARLAMTRQERDEFLKLNEQESDRATLAELERDSMLVERDEARAERDALRAERDEARAERDDRDADLDSALEALADAEAKVKDAKESESALAQMQSALERSEAARDEAERARDAVMADRDFLLVRVDELRAALTRAEAVNDNMKEDER